MKRSALHIPYVVALGSAVVLGGFAAAAQQPTFRTGTTLVEVSAIVTSGGVPVTDLTADEVEVLDEGRPQPLVAFEFVDLTTVEGPSQRRDFVLVLDDRHIAPEQTTAARDFALAFIRALDPRDRLAIVNTGSTELVQQLSTDRGLSESLVRRVRGERSRTQAKIELEVNARITFDVLRNVSTVLQRDGSNERRAVVLVSEGHSVFPEGPEGDQYAEVRDAYMAMLRETSLANAAVYAIDPRGLTVGGVGGVSRQARDPRATDERGLTSSFSALGNELPAVTAESVAAALAARRFGSLGRLASYTGGILTVDTNELDKDIPRILQDSRQYYRLAYVQPDVGSGKVHPTTRRIGVRVSRPGVQVRARQQYVPVTARDAMPAVTLPAEMESGAAAAAVLPIETPAAEESTDIETEAATSTLAARDGVVPMSVAHGPTSRFERGGTYVIRTSAAWQMFWRQVPTRQAAPGVDFDRVTLLAVVLDDETSAAQTPRIEGTRADGSDLVVMWRSVPADTAAGVADDARPRPFVVAGIIDYAGPVRFERVQ